MRSHHLLLLAGAAGVSGFNPLPRVPAIAGASQSIVALSTITLLPHFCDLSSLMSPTVFDALCCELDRATCTRVRMTLDYAA
eukprot:6187769-Pleurochrysis_carterae.AAC.3